MSERAPVMERNGTTHEGASLSLAETEDRDEELMQPTSGELGEALVDLVARLQDEEITMDEFVHMHATIVAMLVSSAVKARKAAKKAKRELRDYDEIPAIDITAGVSEALERSRQRS